MILFSDVHGNHQALERLLAGEVGPWVCAGDLLGRHGSNQACLEMVLRHGVHCIQGNHDRLAGTVYPLADARVLRSWPLERIDERALVVHAPIDVGPHGVDFYRVDTPGRIETLLERRPLVFVGHAHQPGWWEWSGAGAPRWQAVSGPQVLELRPELRYLIQIGSLGEPVTESVPRYLRWEGNRIEWRGWSPGTGSAGA